MRPFSQRGPRALYVAESACEFPVEVRDWLGQTGHRAVRAGNVYDALAMLAAGRRPALLIVSIEAVDWSEIGFFDHVARLSPETRVYVAGQDHHQEKLAAARRHGAVAFSSEAASADLGLASGIRIPPLADVRLAPQPGDEMGDEQPATEAQVTTNPPQTEELHPPPSNVDRPSIRLVSAPEATPYEEPPPVVPWLPRPHQPVRIPPKSDAGAPEGSPQPPADTNDTESTPSVKLTPEELAALLRKPPGEQGNPIREQQR